MIPLHHMIQVRNLDRALEFYQRALRLEIADRHRYAGASLVYLRIPGSRFEIELISPDRWTFAEKPEPGRLHLAFAVADLDYEHARLTRMGVRTKPIFDYVADSTHQTRYFYCSDPEGNQIEFLEPRGRYALQLHPKETPAC